MSTPVVLSASAHRDLNDICQWWAENRSVEQAERWFDCAEAALRGLPTSASSCAMAEESAAFPIPMKQLNFGLSGKLTHRIVFAERPDCIFVLRVRHLAQSALSGDELP